MRFACATKELCESGGLRLVPPPQPASTASTSSGSASLATARLYDRRVKAIVIHEDGGPEVLRYEDAPDPEPAADEVLVRMRFASLNHLDVWTRKGLPSAPKPHILGADGSGVVEALGGEVDGFELGQPVVINPGLEHGAVIEPVARAMADGIRTRAGVQVCIATTGIAGPGGGTPTKPVGTVAIAVTLEQHTETRTFRFVGDREMVKFQATQAAMNLLRLMLVE